jgi:hypothetical protein
VKKSVWWSFQIYPKVIQPFFLNYFSDFFLNYRNGLYCVYDVAWDELEEAPKEALPCLNFSAIVFTGR